MNYLTVDVIGGYVYKRLRKANARSENTKIIRLVVLIEFS